MCITDRLIAVHEGGHFLAAKRLDVQVNEFSIGMGPAIFSRQKGETLYSLRAFPLGGYCAMEGAVSYTHLDVYKRQGCSERTPR